MRGPNWLSLTPWLAMAAVTVIAFTGCQGGPTRRTLASSEPTMSPSVVSGSVIAETPVSGTGTGSGAGASSVASSPTTVRNVTVVDRHPLFSRPREYYENSGSNKVVKTAAAVVVGVPAGIVGELKQIVVGAPAAPGS